MSPSDAVSAAVDQLIALETDPNAVQAVEGFLAYLEEDPSNWDRYIEVETAARLASLGKPIPPLEQRSESPLWERWHRAVHTVRRKAPRPTLWAALFGLTAASLVAIALTPRFIILFSWDRYETKTGELLPVKLEDGSELKLNTDSDLQVRITESKREITLTHGEVFFSVAPDTRRPFIVRVDRSLICATGTRFSVRRENDRHIEATVEQGAVNVPRKSLSAASANLDSSCGDDAVRVTAGHVVTITGTGAAISAADPSTVRRRLSWQSGMLEIDATLANAVVEFNRYNQRKLEIADPTIAQRRVQGLFRTTDPDRFAQAVHEQLAVPYSSSGSAQTKTGIIRLGVGR